MRCGKSGSYDELDIIQCSIYGTIRAASQAQE